MSSENIRKIGLGVGSGVALLAALAFLVTAAFSPGPDRVERVDFGEIVTATDPAFDAVAPPPSDAPIKEFRIPVTHETIEISDGVQYDGWTFGGTVPGPTIRVREGDLVRITLVNESPMGHSIDFHSARIPWNEAYRSIGPRDSLTFEFTARDPGAFLVHCGTPPVTMHIMQGMYLPIVVDPKEGWGTKADREFVLVQSEFYGKRPGGARGPSNGAESGNGEARGPAADGGADASRLPMVPDMSAAMEKRPSHVAFNGRAFQYKKTPLQAEVGDRVRIFVVNAGPSLRSDFHVVGAVFDRVYPDGNPSNALESVQTWSVPAGGGAVFETTFEEGASGEGLYPFVTHAFADAEMGAVGLIRVGSPEASGAGH